MKGTMRGRRLWGFALVIFVFGNFPFDADTAYAQTTCEPTSACPLGIFCTGYEEGHDNIWDDLAWDSTANRRMADPGPCNRAGNTVMRLRIPPGRGGADMLKVLPGGGYDKLYARWYQKFESGFDFGYLSHIGGGFHAGDRNLLGRSDVRPNGADTFNTRLEVNQSARPILYTYYRGMSQQCSDPTQNCYGDNLPAPGTNAIPKYVTNKWYCLEVMMDAGTPVSNQAQANGVQMFWVDGVQYGPWTNLWHRTTANLKINIFWLQLFHHGEHSVTGIMLDDVVVSTTRIGCHGQASTPATPKNLRIVPPTN